MITHSVKNGKLQLTPCKDLWAQLISLNEDLIIQKEEKGTKILKNWNLIKDWNLITKNSFSKRAVARQLNMASMQAALR